MSIQKRAHGMGTAAEFTEVIKFRFGAPVVANDGASGFVDHVIVDADARVVTHVGVRRTRLGGRAHSLPLDVVKDARAARLELSIARSEVAQKAQAVAANLVRWDDRTALDGATRHLGRLAQLTARQDNHALRHLIVDRGLGGGEVVVAAEAITQIAAKRTATSLSDAQINQLIAFRPDHVLEREVNEALYNYPRLRVDLGGIVVRAIDGSVWLRGHISSDLNRRVAGDQLSGIPGLFVVYNQLITDNDLAAAVASALAQDPRTREQHIGVYPTLGTITLRGTVANPSAREDAGAVAAAAPGVARVVNELSVQPGGAVLPILSSVTSRAEMVPGGG